ncbi:MAG: DUF255 domain-containing protein [Acidobacteriota bacterium]
MIARRAMARILPLLAAVILMPVSLYGENQTRPSQPNGEVSPDAAPRRQTIRWLGWSRESFEAAAQLRRPVLLYLRSTDCGLCIQIEHEVLADQEVVDTVAAKTVPILVDVNLRPDLASRYVMSVIPTMVFLLPNGEPIYNVVDMSSLERMGGYFPDREEFRRYLGEVFDYMRARGPELARKAKEVADLESRMRNFTAGPPPFDQVEAITARIREGFDFKYGGYGRRMKILDDGPYRVFRIVSAESGQDVLGQAVVHAAEQILNSPIYDAVEGGFHHYALHRDWTVPAWEKRLEVNARGIRLLVSAAAQAPEKAELREAVEASVNFLLSHLSLPAGGLAFSQMGSLGPVDPGAYFAAPAAERRTLKPPGLDPMEVASAHGEAVVALLEAGALLGRDDLEARALRLVDFMVEKFYRRGRGVSHVVNPRTGQGQQQGLLIDQVAALEAFLAASQVRAGGADLKRSEDLFGFCTRNLRRPAGYFVDRLQNRLAVGSMRRPIVSYGMNGRMALVAYRLFGLTGEPSYRQAGDAVLGALSSAIPKMRGRDAPYLEAVLAGRMPSLRLVLVPGGGRDPVPFRRSFSLLPLAGGVSILGPPDQRPVLAGQVSLPATEPGAYVCRGERCVGPVSRPAGLLEAARAASRQQVRNAGRVMPGPEGAGR